MYTRMYLELTSVLFEMKFSGGKVYIELPTHIQNENVMTQAAVP